MGYRSERDTAALLTVAEMAAADGAAIRDGTSGVVLMEAAGGVVAREIRQRWAPCPTVVLCGPGNNGGDGFVVARRLDAARWPVRVALIGARARLKGDAAAMARRWRGEVVPLAPQALGGAGLIVDAMFGAGLSRDIEGEVRAVVAAANDGAAPIIAIDVPSGVHGDTGAVWGIATEAVLTVNFFRRRPAHWLLPGRAHAGESVVGDIGIAETVLDELRPRLFENSPASWRHLYPWPVATGHKYDRGHAVVVSGGPGQTGAARLAARAALRIGAGLVTVAGPPAALIVNASQLTAIMTLSFAGADGLASLLEDRRKNAVLIGPGNGVGEGTRANVLAALAERCALVLDADALTSFADRPENLFAALHADCLLTPHEGEFARLFGDAGGRDKVSRARHAAATCGATLLLKGADTVVAAPDGRAVINGNAPPELATAGAGDVLSGLALGLMAQGMAAFEAGCAAAWLHGAAASQVGPGLIAEDLSEALPMVLRDLPVGRG